MRSLDPEPHPLWKFPQFPPTLQAYREDPAYWSERIHVEEKYRQGTQIQPDHVVVYGGLPIGTPLEIVQISRWFNGENGTFWIAYAIIRDGEFKGRRILLPWQGSGQFAWIHAVFDPKTLITRDPQVDFRFLTSCEAGDRR